MPLENDFLPFAYGAGANVVTQAAYAALTTLLQDGFSAGTAYSNQLNKVWRQSSIMSAVLATLISDVTQQNAIDDGTTATLVSNLMAAIMKAGYADDTGVVNAYTITLSPAPLAYYDGMVIGFSTLNANTGTSTVNVNGLGAVSITGTSGAALQVGQIPANSPVWFTYNATGPRFELQQDLTLAFADSRYLQLSGGTLTGNLGIGVAPRAWGSSYYGFDSAGLAYVGSGTGGYITGNLYYNGTNWIAPTTGSGMYCFVNYAGFHIAASPSASGGSTVTPTDKFFMDINGDATLSGTLSCANATASGQAVTLGQASKLITSAVTPLPGPNSFISVAHGLGYTPVNVNLELTCLTADQGYSVGDVIYNPAIGASSSNYGPCIAWANSTNVGVGIGSGNNILITNKTTGAAVVPTLANWSYKFVMDRI